MVRTAFTDMVGAEHALVGFSRSPAVVAEVGRAGGFGVLAATAYAPEELDAQLAWLEREVPGAPYGVDLLVPVLEGDRHEEHRARVTRMREEIPAEHLVFVRDLLARHGMDATGVGTGSGRGEDTAGALSTEGIDRLLEVTFSHPVRLVANALGPPPAAMVEHAHAAGVPVAALVGSARHAERQIAAGVDVLVAQGTEAGGHTGTIATTVLTPEVVEVAAGRPVLAAGGIGSGAQMAAALALGADGVWCGSVWLNTVEDITPAAVKAKFTVAGSGDTVRSRTRTGKAARQLRSPWHDAWEGPGAPEVLPMPLQVRLAKDAWAAIDDAAAAGNPGALDLESFFVGQVVGAFGELRTTREVVETMVAGCRERIRALAELVADGRGADQ